ncbi:MAG: DNA methyltransferase [Owenweeksia sp.]|nr:DNA methyltransferase [Owenweeksia sp.]
MEDVGIRVKKRMKELIDDNRLWFGKDGNNMPRFKRFLSEVQIGMVPTSIWPYKEVGHNQEGRQEVKKLFDDKGYFDGPKPVRLLTRILQLTNLKENSVVLDFFSGSGSLAHAVYSFNAKNDNDIKFIQVQLPEPTDEKSEAHKAGFKNICEIGKERIRRAAEKNQRRYRNGYRLRLSCVPPRQQQYAGCVLPPAGLPPG